MTDRLLPYSEEAEMAALGAIIFDADRVMTIAKRLRITPESFFVSANRKIAEICWRMWEDKNNAVDAILVENELNRLEIMAEIGGSTYLSKVMDSCTTEAHAEYYLDIVRQKHILRREIEVCRQIESEAYREERGDDHLKAIPDRFMAIIDDVLHERNLVDMFDENLAKWDEAISRREKGDQNWTPGLPMPWRSLADFTGELVPGLHIIGGEQASGKTTLEGQLAMYWARNGHPVARCTLDVRDGQLAARMLANESTFSLPKIEMGYYGRSVLDRARDSRELLKEIPMWINDQDKDISGICAWGRAMKLRRDIKALTVDYLQKIGASAMGKTAAFDPVRRVDYVTNMLKDLSLELGIPVIALSQFSREVGREGRPPVLSDLKDSSAIEQAAHKVFLLWIDRKKRKSMEDPTLEQKQANAAGVYPRGNPDATKHKRPCWIIKAKDKDGGEGEMPLWMFPPYFYFVEAETRMEEDKWESHVDDLLPEEACKAISKQLGGPKAEAEEPEEEPPVSTQFPF